MKIGDLVKVKDCPVRDEVMIRSGLDFDCVCFFCAGNSNRVGIVVEERRRGQRWIVRFDCGEWRLDMFDIARGDVEVINENR